MSETRKSRGWLIVVLLAAVAGIALFLLRRDRPAGESSAGGADEQRAARAARPWEFGDDPSAPAGAIEGVVRDAKGAPVDGASVFLTRARPRDLPSFEPPKPMSRALSAGGGKFRFDKVPPGDYGVAAFLEGHGPGSRTPLVLEPRATLKVEVTLGAAGLLLTGRVLDDGGAAIPGARVTAVENQMGWASDQRAVPRVLQATAGDDGAYKLPLAAGTYSLTADADGYARVMTFLRMARDQQRDLRLTPAARVVGRVVEGAERRPVPEASVALQAVSRFGGMFRQAVTDENGTFTFGDLEAGTFQLSARRGRGVGAGIVVSVGAAQTTDGVEIALSPAMAVKGRVVTTDGKPIAGAAVQAEREMPPFEPGVFGKSEADGTFALEGVLPGRYQLRAEADGFARERRSVEVKSVDLTGQELKLGAEAWLTGKVVDGTGKGIADVRINAVVEQPASRGRTMSRAATSGPDGRFEIKRVGTGKVTVTGEHAEAGLVEQTLEPLAPGEKREIALTLSPGASIEGTVKYEDGAPAVGAEVTGFPRTMGPRFSGPASDTTDAEGRYRLRPLPKATIMVQARDTRSAGPMMFGGPDDPSRKTIPVEPGEQKTGVDLVIKRTDRSVAGVVVDPDGKPIGGATVMATTDRDPKLPISKPPYSQARVTTMDDGSFKLDDFSEGTYALWATHPRFADGEARGVAAGATGVRIQLERPASVSGVVASSDGRPISTYQITLLPGPKAGETEDDKRRRLMGPAMYESPSLRVHEAGGAFSFSGLDEGTYELRVQTADGQVGTEEVALAAGERKQGLRIVMSAGAAVTGKVVDLETGQPIANARVFVMASGNQHQETADEQGAFTVRGLSPGAVTVHVNAADRGHVGERKELEIAQGAQSTDLGVFKLMKGNFEERMSPDGRPATIGTSVKVDPSGKATLRRIGPETPAAKVGLKEGDIVTAIDGKDIRPLGEGAIGFLLMGKAGTPVQLTVQREGAEPRTVTIERVAFTPPRPPPAAGQGQPQAPARPQAAPAAPAVR